MRTWSITLVGTITEHDYDVEEVEAETEEEAIKVAKGRVRKRHPGWHWEHWESELLAEDIEEEERLAAIAKQNKELDKAGGDLSAFDPIGE